MQIKAPLIMYPNTASVFVVVGINAFNHIYHSFLSFFRKFHKRVLDLPL